MIAVLRSTNFNIQNSVLNIQNFNKEHKNNEY